MNETINPNDPNDPNNYASREELLDEIERVLARNAELEGYLDVANNATQELGVKVNKWAIKWSELIANFETLAREHANSLEGNDFFDHVVSYLDIELIQEFSVDLMVVFTVTGRAPASQSHKEITGVIIDAIVSNVEYSCDTVENVEFYFESIEEI